jgi:serine/threonine-protein kinase RsbW
VNASHKQPAAPESHWHQAFLGTMDGIFAAGQWLTMIATDQELPEQTVFALQLCLEELLSNIVRHGGTGHWDSSGDVSQNRVPPLNIVVALDIDPQRIIMTVEDDGKPFNIENASVHAIDRPLGEIEPGGLGIQLVRNFVSRLSYEQAGLGNRVLVEFLR